MLLSFLLDKTDYKQNREALGTDHLVIFYQPVMTFSCKDKAALYAVSQGFQEDSYPSGTKAVWPTGFSWRFKKLFLNGKTKRVKFNEFSAAPFALSLIF